MWLFVFFDLPAETKTEIRNVRRFKKLLDKDNFSMMQPTVFIRNCANEESVDAHIELVKDNMPERGHVNILFVNDDQYNQIFTYWGVATTKRGRPPKQLELF
ncbi:CRISPR-associated endonuclease Cas2 [Porphyromonadaceae bacterium OttesenSCG-928-L07]|nr:CRISPR-associated endonuclease Cas2 [Porphyromonadaceae bacterium OttesenSCG-928-L07]MDL2251767.1 CRISPR-associated endonuclease Cas2 [Odoribacter sp. OttesenSCG-928-J03]